MFVFVFSANGAGITGYPDGQKLTFTLTPFTIIKSKWIMDINTKL